MNPSVNTPQPAPAPYHGNMRASAHWQVMQDFAERAQLGQEKYGTPLTAENGRNHLIDAYQEMLDFLVYMRLAINEDATRALSTQAEVLPRGTTEEEVARLRDFVQDDEAMADCLYLHGWVCIAPQETAQDVINHAVADLRRHGWQMFTDDANYAEQLRANGWQCFAPGKTSLAFDEMAAILRTGGMLVYEQLDGHPVLTREELEAEALRQGCRIEPLAVECPPEEIARRITDEWRARRERAHFEPSSPTILQMAQRLWREKNADGETMSPVAVTLLESALARHHYRADDDYALNAAGLSRLLPGWFPPFINEKGTHIDTIA
jgi:hypothetical protein